MTRRARPTIATLAVVALAGIPVGATISQAAAPPPRASLAPASSVQLLAEATGAAGRTSATSATSAPTTVGSVPASPPSTPVGASGPDTTLATVDATAAPAPSIVPQIGDALTVSPDAAVVGGPVPIVDAVHVTNPDATAVAVAVASAEPAAATTVASPDTADATDAADPLSQTGVGTAPSAGRMTLPNPGPLSPNQIDRITLTATPTALRDLLTVKVVFLGDGGVVLDTSRFTIRFVGRDPRTQSFDVTVPNGTVTLSISWSSAAAPVSVDEVSVSVIGVAPPGSGI